MKYLFTLVLTFLLFSCNKNEPDKGLANGSISSTVYFTKSEDCSVFYAVFPSPLWGGTTTTMQDEPFIPSKGVFIISHIRNGLWVDGVKKDIPSEGGAFYLQRSGDLVKMELSKDELNSLAAEKGIKLANDLRAKYSQAELQRQHTPIHYPLGVEV